MTRSSAAGPPRGARGSGGAGRPVRRAEPVQPNLVDQLTLAELPDDELTVDARRVELSYVELDLSGQDGAHLDIEQCRFSRTSLAGVRLDRVSFVDCVVASSDWANLAATRCLLRRVEFTSVRLTGLQWTDGALRDVTFRDCRMDLAGFRFSRFKDVHFVEANLAGADFTNADLTGATFVGCDLSGAQFSNASALGARFVRCDLHQIGGLSSLAGAVVAANDLLTLTQQLAEALGITVEAG